MSNLKEARRTAIDLLARREHSSKELSTKLAAKNYAKEDIETVITELVTNGTLSDQRFTEVYVRSRAGKGYGPIRIRMELAERGISPALCEEFLDMQDAGWLELVRKVWHKRFGKNLPTDFKTRAQQARFLQYRGFTSEQINSVFKVECAFE